ncbi:metallophosphoesterase [Aurantimonas sp. C2-6-R+9]|uniref:metallophosphoesterase n=1 Tax=unclassified Aurantimonas TaxID=2638230 RepID=UPI002E19087B|nr:MULTISPECIES: metallophosphoesterase [unclassified Aurantimonas]MEC5292564.1 metallophosphoesterase [Aurantimonas sp. C2-3-R2]MEC5382793.1 metallophosphoesterase [Aurantimonas sp. C2-6-R+9]MEC5413596.1 metallophosphoesterase [Aurantimonas sp. C2-4-R8]
MSPHPSLIAAIGDVHGASGLLSTLLQGLDTVAESRKTPMEIIFLGDIVDRGPDSRGALDLVVEAIATHPNSRLLIGNHDWWLLQFLKGELDIDAIDNWLDQGGAATLASYGAAPAPDLEASRRRILRDRPEHLKLLSGAASIAVDGSFAFVHAGIDPRRPIDRQDTHDCLWIRAPFLNHIGRLSHVVVHGHQPQKGGRPVVTENRISMDTGAVFTGRLAAVVIERDSDQLEFFAATAAGGFAAVEPVRLDRGLGTVLDAPEPIADRL